MNKKYEQLLQLYKEHSIEIVANKENWKSFLDTATNLYKYKFSEQVLINLQRPDATACASMKIWNENMKCWINRGADGIFIIDDLQPEVYRYVFDISDVHKLSGGRLPKPLKLENNDQKLFALEHLEEIFALNAGNKNPIERIENIVKKAIENYYIENNFIGDDIYDTEYFYDTLQESIKYIIFSKYNIKDGLEFAFLNEFTEENTVYSLGTFISDISENILTEIRSSKIIYENLTDNFEKIIENNKEKTYNALKRESVGVNTFISTDISERSEYNGEEQKDKSAARGRDYIRTGRERDILSGSVQTTDRADGRNRQIWENEREVYRGNESGTERGDGGEFHVEGSLEGNSRIREGNGGTPDRTDEGERGSNRAAKENGLDGIRKKVTEHNLHGSGNSDERNSVFVNNETINQTSTTDRQINFLFDDKAEENKPSAFSLPKNLNDTNGNKEQIIENSVNNYELEVTNSYIIDSNYIENLLKRKKQISEAEIEVLPNDNDKKKSDTTNSNNADNDEEEQEKNNFDLSSHPIETVGKKERFRQNYAAISLLKKLQEENRFATLDEQHILSKYVGWGGIPEAFDENNNSWKKEYSELRSALTDEEYVRARESTLTAFYTPPEVINAVYGVIENMGFRNGNLIEPSCGTGNFIGMLPKSMENAKIYGVELDNISAAIAQQLYQKSSITAQGYENTNFPDSFFDVAVGNVPFGDFKVSDRKYDKNKFLIHDYFFAKTLDKVRSGGVIAFITSKGTLDKENPNVRKYIAQRAELLGAIRLPNNTFKGNAGTEVVSDILFLQKRDRLTDIEPDWVHLGINNDGVSMNSYFVEHPEMILGELKTVSGRFGEEVTCEPFENANLPELLNKAAENIHGTIDLYERESENNTNSLTIPADPTVKNYSYTILEDKVYFRENSIMTLVDKSADVVNRIKGMAAIRDCVRELFDYQLNENYTDEDIKNKQNELNILYDNFVNKNGFLNSRTNKSAFGNDSAFPLLCALENVDDDGKVSGKSDIFYKRTIAVQKKSHLLILLLKHLRFP